jgi:peptide/nickel transport system permease protein
MSGMAGIGDSPDAPGGRTINNSAGTELVARRQRSDRPSGPSAPERTASQRWRLAWSTAPVTSRIGLIVTTVLILAALLAPVLPLQDPLAQALSLTNRGPSLHHLFGTDYLGRDVFSRIVYGTRSSYEGVLVGLLVTMIIGIPWGLIAGFGGTAVDEVLMRAADGLLSFPGIVLALGFISVLGPSLYHAMIAIGVVTAPSMARLLRSTVLPIRRAEYVLVSGALGAGRLRIALRHVLPNAMGPVLVQGFSLGSIFLIVGAGLSFLGFGVQPPAPSWGADLVSAYQYFVVNPFGTVVPGLVITIAAWSISAVGDGVREAVLLS